jgi:hypothetical protein
MKKKSRQSRKQRLEKQEGIWLISSRIVIPKGFTMKSPRDYSRKREKNIRKFLNEY